MGQAMATQKSNIPALRFPEFKGEWDSNEFDFLASRYPKKYDPDRDEDDPVCIELESLSQETGVLLETFNAKNLA